MLGSIRLLRFYILMVGALLWLTTPMVVSAAPASQTDTVECHGESATIVHIGYDSAIFGTAGDDVIVVDGGWNSVHAGAGDDKVCVLGHFNVLEGEDGDDAIKATGLHNALSGGDGDDTLEADDASSQMQGGEGSNRCNGSAC